MLQTAFLLVAAFLLYRAIGNLGSGRPANVVPTKKLAPHLTQALHLADGYYDQKKYVAAEKAYLNVLKLDHKNLQAYKRLGLIYTALKNYADAIECLQIAAQLSPSAQSYYALGLVLYENQNYIKAISAYEKSLIFEPNANHYVSLAKAYQKLANTMKAISALEKAAELQTDKHHLSLLAEAYIVAKDWHNARQTYERILELDPTDPKAQRIVRRLATV